MSRTPIAVLISDVHYNIQTLEVADKAMRLAIKKSNELIIPLVVAGDLHDTKANLRGECIEAMINAFCRCQIPPYILVGNHDKINEKSDNHSLKFLDQYAILVDEPMDMPLTGAHGIPYHHDPEELKSYLKTISKGATLIMHQGVQNSNSGHYIQDKSALPRECFADFRVISGHYHTRQDIRCGRPQKGSVGLFSYIGNPYTLNFAEANDPPKGFQILYDDGSLEFVPTNLRKHVVIEINFGTIADESNTAEVLIPNKATDYISQDDLVWIKVSGTREQLKRTIRQGLADSLYLRQDFKLDLIPLDSETLKPKTLNQTQPEILDGLIDSLTNTSNEQKRRVKSLWKGL